MIVFLPNQGGFTRKMTPAAHMESLNREQRLKMAGINSVNTDEFIDYFNEMFRDGMMIEGELAETGVPTFEYDEEKLKVLFRAVCWVTCTSLTTRNGSLKFILVLENTCGQILLK